MTPLPSVRGRPRLAGARLGGSVLRALGSATVIAALIVLAFQVLLLITGKSGYGTGELADADSYMRLQRVLELADTGRWYDPYWTRTNAPYGETMHYTRPLDAILFAGAWLGSAVTEFRTALWFWGGALSPILLLIGLLVLRWGFAPLLQGRAAFALFVLLACVQPALSSPFMVGRPDHHSLIALLLMAQLACLGRMTGDRDPRRLALATGVLGGLGIWVSVELVLAQALVAAALAVLWLWSADPERGPVAIRNYTLGILVALSLALALERPVADWTTPAVARISIVHWWLGALAFLTWVAISGAENRWRLAAPRPIRALLIALGGLVPAVGMLLAYPAFFAGPWHDFGPLVRAWLDGNFEMQPLLPYNLERASKFFLQLGPVAVALLFTAWRVPWAPLAERQTLCILALGLAIYVPLAIAQLRWAMYVQILVLLPWTLCLVQQWRWRGALQLWGRRVPLRTGAFALALLSHLVVAGALSAARPAAASDAAHAPCRWPEVAAYLDRRHRGGANDDVLLTYLFPGSEMMWRTPYDVVGTPHGNERALLDTHRIFDARTDQQALEVVNQRGIDLILICRTDSEARFWHDIPAEATIAGQLERGVPPDFRAVALEPAPDQLTFHTRLRDGLLPPWIEPVPLPPELAPFQLFRVLQPEP